MKRVLLPVFISLLTVAMVGCTFARYSKVRVQVVDAQTKAGIPKARVRAFYVKPMMDMTYQRKDREQTDMNGFATLSVATNWSQRMILGWTHGIVPQLYVQAHGYSAREVGIPDDAFGRAHPLLIQMQSTK